MQYNILAVVNVILAVKFVLTLKPFSYCTFSGSSSSTKVTPVMGSKSLLNISAGSPQSAQRSRRKSAPDSVTQSTVETTARLVDISDGDGDGEDEDDVAVTQFGRLKVGFTPGTDANHRSRRVCAAFHRVCWMYDLLFIIELWTGVFSV